MFSTILRKYISHCLFDVLILIISDQTYGLIFLSPWAAAETENSVREVPRGVWFANQVFTFHRLSLQLSDQISDFFLLLRYRGAHEHHQ